MIVTVTLNPSLDRTIQVDRLVRGAVHRAGDVRLDAGGKGVNIARALAGNGHKVRAVFPKGGADGDELAWLLSRAGIDYRAVPIGDAVRTNVSIVEPDGTVTKLNTPGPVLTAAEIDALIAATLDAAAGAIWVVCSGSLPPAQRLNYVLRLLGHRERAGQGDLRAESSVPAEELHVADLDRARPRHLRDHARHRRVVAVPVADIAGGPHVDALERLVPPAQVGHSTASRDRQSIRAGGARRPPERVASRPVDRSMREAAQAAALEGGTMIREAGARTGEVEAKGAGDYVTEVDHRAEEAIRRASMEHAIFRCAPIVGPGQPPDQRDSTRWHCCRWQPPRRHPPFRGRGCPVRHGRHRWRRQHDLRP